MQNTVRTEARKNLPEKIPVGKNPRQEIWVGSIAHTVKSPSYEGYTATHPYLQNMYSNKGTANSQLFKETQTSYETTAKLELSLVK